MDKSSTPPLKQSLQLLPHCLGHVACLLCFGNGLEHASFVWYSDSCDQQNGAVAIPVGLMGDRAG